MMRLLKRAMLATAGLIVALAIGLGLALLGTLPDTEGSLGVAGISAPVEIGRDRHGVPHIRAASADDAYFGLGLVHAQDRFWQMEAMRRLATGRLSEVIGPPTLKRDRFMRTLGFSRLVRIQYDRLEAPVRRALVAYAAGVNAWMERRRWLLPPEFMALRYRPEPWRPTDSLLWAKVMALDLSRYWRDKLLRQRLSGRLTGEQIDQLWPIGYRLGPAPSATKGDRADTDAAWLALPGPARQPRGASNSWVVAGSRTAVGKPILANDPHLGFRAPILWYLARLSAPGLEVTGATLPGFPFTLLGHNGRIAWGMTSAENDQQDLFVERPLEGDGDRYRTPDGPRRFHVRHEVIAVRGAPDVEMTVRETRHGPVLSDMVGGGAEAGDVLALAAVFLRPDDTTPQALYRVNRARNWGEFTAALEEFHAPQMAFTYADTDGNIGFIMPGKVPVRRFGRSPAPGWTGEADWSGFIPFAELPRGFNPPGGKIVAANQDLTPPGYPHFISADWSPGYRARRIHDLLDSRQDAETTARIQRDTVSLMARHLLPLMLRVTPRSMQAKRAIAMLGAWDGAMSRHRAEPAIFTAWLRALNRAVYGDELGPLLGPYWSLRPRFMVAALSRRAEWCDDIGTAVEETCNEQLELALEEALRGLSDRLGPDMAQWRWGDLHQARFRHGVLGRLPIIGRLVNLAIETDGGNYTVNRGASSVGSLDASFDHIHGPGLRAIYDTADLEGSRFIIATGQSGNPLSPHYGDLLEAWRDGRFLTIPAEGRTVEGRLKLVPMNRER